MAVLASSVRTMILAEAVLDQRLGAGPFELETRGVHEHQVEPGEQVAPIRKQPLLHRIFQAARSERRAAVLLSWPLACNSSKRPSVAISC
jgi:hypothetical protein